MLGIFFILLLTLISLIPIYIVRNNDKIIKIIVGWYSFGLGVGYIEFCMFINQNYLTSDACPINNNTNWYLYDYPIYNLVSTKIWADAWKEYCIQSGDFRYLETMKFDFVPWIEFCNAILAYLFGIIILYGIITKQVKYLHIMLLILIVSCVQIYGTIIYFVSYFSKCYYKLDSINLLWFIHLIGMNGLWIIFPIILINHSIKYIIYYHNRINRYESILITNN